MVVIGKRDEDEEGEGGPEANKPNHQGEHTADRRTADTHGKVGGTHGEPKGDGMTGVKATGDW